MLPETQRYFLHPELAVPGHRVQILLGGEQAYPAMLEAISRATREVFVETYTWASDDFGRRFAAALIERARAGVRVCAMMDGIGSIGFSGALAAELRQAGVELTVFHPVAFAFLRKRRSLSVRDHRKLLVVDGAVAFLGGLNLSAEYAPVEWGGRGWHDVHVRLEGPCTRDLEWLFDLTWRYAAGGKLLLHKENHPDRPSPGDASVQVLAIESRGSRRLIRRHLEHALKRATGEILIMAAYFIPDRGLRAILRKAVGRGVRVRVLLPRHSDVPIVQEAARHTYKTLLASGVQIFEWLPSMLHAKSIVVDGRWCTVGSYNLDRRSLVYNWELSIATDDRGACDALQADFARLLDNAVRIEKAVWRRRSAFAKLIQYIAYLLRNWL